MERTRGARQAAACFRAWLSHGRRARRNARVAAAAAAARALRAGRAALSAWVALGAGRRARLHAEHVDRMGAYVAQLQGEVEEARAERYAALARARAYQERCLGLQQEARRQLLLGAAHGGVGSAPGG